MKDFVEWLVETKKLDEAVLSDRGINILKLLLPAIGNDCHCPTPDRLKKIKSMGCNVDFLKSPDREPECCMTSRGVRNVLKSCGDDVPQNRIDDRIRLLKIQFPTNPHRQPAEKIPSNISYPKDLIGTLNYDTGGGRRILPAGGRYHAG